MLAMRQSLWQAAQVSGQPAVVVTCAAEHLPCDVGTPVQAYTFSLCKDEAETEAALAEASLYYQTPSGVILFVLSLLLSRGCGGVKQDMDEPDSCLVQRFGHCSQELLNLAITGRATSGVFDGTKSLAEDMGAAGAELADVPGLSMRGVLQQPSLGYLTQLEALRYTSVGSHFKEPAWPIYVLASSSHYSLLFALEHAVIQPTPSAIARRAFDGEDASGGGMIQADALERVLKSSTLNTPYAGRLSQSPFHKVANDPSKLQQLRSALDSGGIVLWGDFWRAVRPVCTGESEELAPPAAAADVAGGTGTAAVTDPDPDAAPSVTVPPSGFPGKREWAQAVFDACDSGGGQFLTEGDAKRALKGLTFTPPATDATREELWKGMNALSDGMGVVFFDVFFTAVEGTLAEPPPAPPVPAPSVPLVRSDSELARSLQQAEYGPTEGGGQSPPAAAAGGNGGGSSASEEFLAPALRELTVYHFNGLSTASRGPRCVRLRLKQPDAGGSAAAEAEAFAQLGSLEAILLQGMGEAGEAGGGLQGELEGGSTEALAKQRQKDLEAIQSVLRTKWSGATVVACDQLVQSTAEGTSDEGGDAPAGVDTSVWGQLGWKAAAPPKID